MTKEVDHRYKHNEVNNGDHMMSHDIHTCMHAQELTSLCWMGSGKEFAASFYDGTIGVWSVKSTKGPEKLFAPHGTQLAILCVLMITVMLHECDCYTTIFVTIKHIQSK